jgi:glycolate oxidase FAD binding subunit
LAISLASEAGASAGDLTEALAETVRLAAQAKRTLRIVGGDTKAFYGRPVAGAPISLAGHSGIMSYDPSELVVVARAGTPLAEIEARLGECGQQLAFEPPRLGPRSTIGGVLAAGLSGPRRPFAGAVRDAVLGVAILDGRGQLLRFGGQVFKNVAGFDVFRLMAGAQGQLGVILEVSLRVAPIPRGEAALALELEAEMARAQVIALMRRQTTLSGAFHDGTRLHLRLSGGEAGVAALAAELGGEAEGLGVWDAIRDLSHPALDAEAPLWRLSLPQTAPTPTLGRLVAWDWAGALRWIAADAPAAEVWRAAGEAGGHATLFHRAGPADDTFQPLAPSLLALHQRLKSALDPAGILNPGRLYPDL